MIWAILILALVLRLIGLNQSLWLDEAINVVASQNLDFFSFVSKYPIGDYHPPGYFALLWVWTHLFGFSEISARLPSVLLGVGTVYLTYLLGKELFPKKVAILASLFLAFAPLHVYYSQEARMYSLSAFVTIMSYYFLVKLINGEGWAKWGYLLSIVLILYSDYVTYLVLPAQLALLIFNKKNIFRRIREIREIGVIWGLGFLFLVPWLFVLPLQIAEGIKGSLDLPGWKMVAGGANFKDLSLVWVKMLIGRISFENKLIYGGVVGFLSILWGIGGIGPACHALRSMAGRGIREMREIKGLVFWIFVPLTLAFGISFFIPMLSYFRMIYILPACYLLLAFGLVQLPKSIFRLATFTLISCSFIFLTIYYTNPKFQREDWRGAVNFLKSVSSDQSVVLFENNTVPSPFIYYQKSLTNSFAGLEHIQVRDLGDVRDLGVILKGKDEVYLFEYLVEITDPNGLLEKKIEDMGFFQKNIYNFSGVGFIKLYQK